jgi:VWFA-related protein
MTRSRVVGGVVRGALVVALTTVATLAQTPAHTVTLDVVVDGNTPAPLKASDFVVTEAGQPIAIDSARNIDTATGGPSLPVVSSPDDERTAASEAGRILGVYVDEYHLSSGVSLDRARAGVAAFIRTALGPRDLVAVVRPLDSLLTIRLTPDRDAVAHVIENAEGRQGDYVARNEFEKNFIAGAPAKIDAARTQVAVSAINALATHIGQFGSLRKTLLVLSDGMSGPVRTRGLLPNFDAIARAANRGHVAVYVLHPSFVQPPAAADPNQSVPADPLAALATQTTGFTVDGVDRLDVALARLLHDASNYYELTLTPPPQAADGRYRAVAVSLRNPRTPIRARTGYALPMPIPAAVAPKNAIAEGLRIPRHASPLIRTWFGQSAAGNSQTRVAFVWEAAPLVPGDRTARTTTAARLSLKATTLDGTELFSGSSGPSRVDALGPPIDKTELSFDAPPGPVVLQMEIFDTSGRTIDHDVRDLSVAGFKSPVSLGTVAVYRARAAHDIRDLQQGKDGQPAVSRQFSRAEHLVLRAPVASRVGPATVTARLTSGFGALIHELPVALIGEARDLAQVDIPLAPLASGPYQVEFTARADGGSATEHLQFTVTP